MRKHIWNILVAVTSAAALAGCLGTAPSGTQPGTGGSGSGAGSGSGSGNGATGGGSQTPAENPTLTQRQVDYGQALRTASIKLVGDLPTLDEIAGVKDAATYAAQIDKYLADPRLARQIRSYFQDMMKMGGSIQVDDGNGNTQTVSLDGPPTFAAELVVKDQPMTNLFTATDNTCPSLDPSTGTFTDAACAQANGQPTVGVLTDAGAMAQFFSHMAFRRVRWIQESFDCTRFPTEYSSSPKPMGSGMYVSPWPFTSVEGGTDKTLAPVNFQDTSSVVCANCHTTMNHLAPLFANFDVFGQFQTSIQVQTPVPGNPTTKLTDWLPPGETQLAWRFGKPVNNLTDLGAAMAADPAVMACQVQRAWNWAMSKGDIVDDLEVVPDSTVASIEQLFVSNGYKLKPVLKAIFTSDDFVKF